MSAKVRNTLASIGSFSAIFGHDVAFCLDFCSDLGLRPPDTDHFDFYGYGITIPQSQASVRPHRLRSVEHFTSPRSFIVSCASSPQHRLQTRLLSACTQAPHPFDIQAVDALCDDSRPSPKRRRVLPPSIAVEKCFFEWTDAESKKHGCYVANASGNASPSRC